MEFIVFKAVGS